MDIIIIKWVDTMIVLMKWVDEVGWYNDSIDELGCRQLVLWSPGSIVPAWLHPASTV